MPKDPIVIQGGELDFSAYGPLLQVLQQRNEIRLRSQQLDLERQRTDAAVAQTGAATAESRARAKQITQEIELEQKRLAAADHRKPVAI